MCTRDKHWQISFQQAAMPSFAYFLGAECPPGSFSMQYSKVEHVYTYRRNGKLCVDKVM